MKKNILFVLSAIFLLVFGFLAGFYLATNKFTRLLAQQKQEVPTEFDHPSFDDNNFYEMIFFGGNIRAEDQMQPLPEGKGVLKGKFVFENKPASGIKFDITLNDSYIKKSIITDENGNILINLPPGKWFINMIACKSWKNKPKGEYILVSGNLPWLETNYLKAGKEILITDAIPQKEQIVITINPRIKLAWPNDSKEKQEATIAESKIAWDPYPDAEKYRIIISRVTREGRQATSFRPIVTIETTKETVLPLKKLPYTSDQTAKEEYSVQTQALRKSGELLSESQFFGGSFILTDGNVLIETGILRSDLNQEKLNRIYYSTKIMNAVEVLIDERMLNEADILLNKFEDYNGQGEKELLMGYLSAAKGNCAEAKKYFDLALQKGQKCIPEKYQLSCK
jgi:hypothetical protein